MTEIRASRWFRTFSIPGILVFWGMAFIGWMAYTQEGDNFGRVMMGPTLAIGVYWLLALATAPAALQFGPDALTIRRWLGRKRVAYAEITAVSQTYAFIHIRTTTGAVRLHKLYANDDARFFAALEQHVPVGQQARTGRLQADFPLVITEKRTAVFFTVLIGLVLSGFGGMAIWFALTDPASLGDSSPWFAIGFGLLSLAFGLLFLYLVLWNYPRRTTFTANRMTRRFLLRTEKQPMQDVIAFTPGVETRTVRGVPRQLFHIAFTYKDGRSYQWIPGEFSFPVDYVDAYEANRVQELSAQLRRLYLSAAPAPEPASSGPQTVESAWGTAYVRGKLKSAAHDFVVVIEDYGEHHMGAETVHFVPNRPLHGRSRFRTTNGHAALSADGRFLLIQDPNLLLLFDLTANEACHRRSPQTHIFLQAEFKQAGLVVRTLELSSRQRESERPLPPAQALAEWHPGLGPAENEGELPSAYPSRPQARQPSAPPAPNPTAQAEAIVNRAKALPTDKYMHAFETLRDELNGLDPAALAVVLNAALNHSEHAIIDLLVTVLADNAYPPAMPHFVRWLDHANDEVRFAAALALDGAVNGRFQIDQMIDGGWVQHDQIRAAVPAIREWWQTEGETAVPTLTDWLAARAAQRPITEPEKRYNFMELNPTWVFLGDGTIFQPEAGYTLPRAGGVHLVGGQVRLFGERKPRAAVFEMKADAPDPIHKIVVKENGRWLDVTTHAVEKRPTCTF